MVSGVFAFHLMSANISGPIKRNKTFFLSGWQRHHERSGNNQNADVPSPRHAERRLQLSSSRPWRPTGSTTPIRWCSCRTEVIRARSFPNNQIPRSRFDPAAVKFLGLNPFRGENNRNNQTFYDSTGPRQNLSVDTNKNSYRSGFDEKIDHSFSDKHKIFGRYSNARHRSMSGTWQMQLANRDLDYIGAPIPIDQHQVVVSDSYVINPDDHQRGAPGLEPPQAHTAPRKPRTELGGEIRHPQCRRPKPCPSSRPPPAASSISASRKARPSM